MPSIIKQEGNKMKENKHINLAYALLLTALVSFLMLNHWFRGLNWMPMGLVAIPSYIMLYLAVRGLDD